MLFYTGYRINLGKMKSWSITGTFHGSIVYAATEGEARRAFHQKYNGESIVACYERLTYPLDYTNIGFFGPIEGHVQNDSKC